MKNYVTARYLLVRTGLANGTHQKADLRAVGAVSVCERKAKGGAIASLLL